MDRPVLVAIRSDLGQQQVVDFNLKLKSWASCYNK